MINMPFVCQVKFSSEVNIPAKITCVERNYFCILSKLKVLSCQTLISGKSESILEEVSAHPTKINLENFTQQEIHSTELGRGEKICLTLIRQGNMLIGFRFKMKALLCHILIIQTKEIRFLLLNLNRFPIKNVPDLIKRGTHFKQINLT